MNHTFQALHEVARSCSSRITRGLFALCAAAVLLSGATAVQAQTAPVIDGNGDDIISFVAGLGPTSCSVDRTDNRDDIVIADPKIIVCADQEDTDGDAIDDYFVNGFDVRRFVLVYDRPNKNLYLLFRMEGLVGDVDGNGNPDNNLCAVTPSFGDQPGIGSQENYQVRIDINCDGLPDVEVKVGGVGEDQINVTGASIGSSELAYRAGGSANGKDLEVKITNIDLPPVFRASANANASFDGLGEDITATGTCGDPKPTIDLTKSVNVPVICPEGTADFTLVVTNTGNVDLTGVTVVDNLPAGLVYQETVSNTCGGAVNANGAQISYGPFNLAVGASCTIVLRVGRTAECAGQQVNNASVEGTFSSPCFNQGQPTIVSDKASASVLCGNVVCSIDAPDLRVCPGETVEICGPVGEYSYAWSNGATTRCITVGAGTYSLVVTEIASGCSSTNPCSVTVVEDPRPTCSISAPDTRVCPGETVEICGPEGNYSYLWNTGATTRCITVGAGTYSLVITDLATGCVSNNECAVTIVEDPRPVCEISAPDTRVCPGETVEICGPEGNYSYLWNTGATTRCLTVGAGTYSLVITDLATGCVSNNECAVTIVEDPRPVCEISAPDTRVCPGETVEICGPEGNYSYAWNTGATTRCITVGAGTYSLVITDLATGCVSNNTCSVTIVEDPRPTCEIIAPDTRVCPGETVEICGPVGNYSYAWNTGATTRCITVGAGTYSLVITDLATGCVSNNTCSVTIVEDPRPTCEIIAPDTRVCPGETVEICGPVGNYSYAWNTGATTRCITVGAGTYSLVITDLATGCVSNNSCAVTIVEDPRPVCEISAPDTQVCPGETVEICGPVGNYSYAWNTGATTRCITVGVGTYSLVITDLATGCVSNNTCAVTIVENPRPNCEIIARESSVCPGETTEICGPVGNYSYAWSTGATTRCITVGAGTYTLTITDLGSGCTSDNSCSVTITEDPRPTCEIIAPDTRVCPGETVEICGPVGPYTYAWSTGATTRCITVGAGVFSLVITNTETGCVSNNNCSVTIVEDPRPTCEIIAPDTRVCPGETVEICGPVGPYTYAWSTGATTRCITVGAGVFSLVITNTETGCVSNNNCSVTIVEDPRPTCEIIAPDTRVCPGETVEICGPVGPYTYAWSTGATTRCITVGLGTYSLVITNTETGCSSNNSCSVTIVEDERPTCQITAPDTRVCPGETVEICGPEGNYSYAWSNGATTRCITVGAGTYSLVITTVPGGCVSSNDCSVTIVEDPRPICEITGNLEVCPGEQTEICGPEGNYGYAWSTGATTRCITVGVGTYSLEITNLATGCKSNNPCTATVVERGSRPCVALEVDAPAIACVGAPVQICGTVTNCSSGPQTITLRMSNQSLPPFENVGPGESRKFCFTKAMPACENGDVVEWVVTALVTSPCGILEHDASDETKCKRPAIDVEKTAEAQIVDGGTIHYEITVTNPSSEVALENVVVTDQLCNYVRYKGNASPAPFSQPAVDAQGGTIVWKIPSLAKGQTMVLRFEAQAWLAGANITCPSEIKCTNYVEAVGYCAGAGNVGPVEDDDTAETVIYCRIDNCPRTVGFWTQQCAQKSGGSTKFTRAQMDQIAGCVDATSSFFNWTNDFDSFCRIINPPSPMDQRKQAKRQFAALLANYCTDQLNLTPNNGAALLLDPNTPVNCGGFAARTIGQLIIEIDGLLASLEGQDLNSGSVKTKYTNIISCTDAINNGVSIPTTPTCEHGGTTSGSATGGADEAGWFDVYGIELYRPFPNPFTTTTQFGFEVMQDEGANVDVAIYDVSGRKVRQLVTGTQPAGRQLTSWDGRNDAGVTLPRGVYFVRTVIAGEKAPIQRLLFVR